MSVKKGELVPSPYCDLVPLCNRYTVWCFLLTPPSLVSGSISPHTSRRALGRRFKARKCTAVSRMLRPVGSDRRLGRDSRWRGALQLLNRARRGGKSTQTDCSVDDISFDTRFLPAPNLCAAHERPYFPPHPRRRSTLTPVPPHASAPQALRGDAPALHTRSINSGPGSARPPP